MYDDFLHRVDVFFRSVTRSDIDLISTISDYLQATGGKRVRPRMCFLVAKSCGYNDIDTLVKTSVIIELIHTATLMHDDVVDIANIRRGAITAHKKWSVPAAILVGDFLYSRSFQLALELENIMLVRVLADTSNLLAEGEVAQLVQKNSGYCDENKYYDIIYKKTGVLFSAACECAAILAGVDDQVVVAATYLGKNVGMAFQIIDDVIDYQSGVKEMGKTAGADFLEGKVTLPLIHLLSQVGVEDKEKLLSQLGTDNESAFLDVCKLMQKHGSYSYCREQAKSMITQAITQFEQVCNRSSFSDELIKLVLTSIVRTG